MLGPKSCAVSESGSLLELDEELEELMALTAKLVEELIELMFLIILAILSSSWLTSYIGLFFQL